LKQRKTQTFNFWQEEFQIGSSDIEFISNQILEENRIFYLGEIALLLVQKYCEEEEQQILQLQDGRLYQPQEHYEVGERVFFPQLDFAVGMVTHLREGTHPNYDNFSVIGVTFREGQPPHEFAAGFQHDHALNLGSEGSLADLQGLMTPEDVYSTYQKLILTKIKATLSSNADFARFQDQYFLVDLLPEFQEGLFNIADATIDINNKPLSIDSLVQEMRLAGDAEVTDITRFLVNYKLAGNENFKDVGPTGQILWYLTRLQPSEAVIKPLRLEIEPTDSYDVSLLDDDLQVLLAEIDDESTHPDDILPVAADVKEIIITLIYSHWRSGTLPITLKTQTFFPSSSHNPVLLEFVDGRTGDSFPGWVSQHKYVFGLNNWYKKNALPVGTFIRLQRTDDPLRIIVNFESVRSQRDWVRQASVENHKLVFKMNTGSIGCKYDELMMIGEDNSAKVDELWFETQEKDVSVYSLLCAVFPELSKLSPQSTVHAKTLYTAVNFLRRTSPGIVFQELVEQPEFVGMNHGYWSYNPHKDS
jgi:hypothetical protein